MIETKFISYSEVESFFRHGEIKLLIGALSDRILVCSVADVLYIDEQYKKNNIQISLTDLQKYFKILSEQGNIIFPEIDRNSLLQNMFTENNELWNKACNSSVSPRFSMSLIGIKVNDMSCWSQQLFDEMEEYYLNFESYG